MSRHPLPAAAYALVDRTPGAVLLEGAEKSGRNNEEPWTRLFTAPLRVLAAYAPDEIPGLFAEIERAIAGGLSAAGFFSYECGLAFEPKAGARTPGGGARRPSGGMRPPHAGLPLAWFGIYEGAYVFDHECGEFAEGAPEELKAGQGQSAVASEEMPSAEFALAEPEYARRIAAIHEFIRAGDVYQLNFTAPFRVHAPGPAAALYAHLRARQPTAYGAFLHWAQNRRVLSFSPELFFRIDERHDGRRIVTRPMKGTAPRGRTTSEDRGMADWLRSDSKNRSENLMIVDLLRNDLGRVARSGSVRVEELFAVERLPRLWQMTSTITAELRSDVGFEAVFRALFPCGSITGAPKVRATQLIGELEDGPRGVYTGAIGFFSPEQTVFNVAIRTLELEGERGVMGVGSGIVIDSDPAAEYCECLLKAGFLRHSACPTEQFSLIESMLWDGRYPLLELHLDRLADSADYFDFPCDRAAVKSALETYARGFADGASRKVRLLLDSAGAVRIADETLAARGDSGQLRRVRMARERTDPADPMLFHKTTHRPLYARGFEEALREGLDDVLFLNTRGELTESARSNIFVEKDGRWYTPPLQCGLLGGVYRRYLLEMRPEIEERVLSEDDLRNADAIYLANSVRGLRKVVLIDI